MKRTLVDRLQGCLIGYLINEQITHSLVGKIHLTPWSKFCWQIVEDLITYQGHKFSPDTCHKFTDLSLLNNSSKLALATLSLQIFCHESGEFWQQQLSQLLSEKPPVNFTPITLDLRVFFHLLQLIITEELKPKFVLPQLLERVVNFDTVFLEKLKLIDQQQQLGTTGIDLSKRLQIYDQPEQNPLVMAIYYFSDTILDGGISLDRAKYSPIEPLLTSSLTASLTGLYHGEGQMPLKWRMISHNNPLYANYYHLSAQLFALWCGVNQPRPYCLSPSIAVAAPGIIQKRG